MFTLLQNKAVNTDKSSSPFFSWLSAKLQSCCSHCEPSLQHLFSSCTVKDAFCRHAVEIQTEQLHVSCMISQNNIKIWNLYCDNMKLSVRRMTSIWFIPCLGWELLNQIKQAGHVITDPWQQCTSLYSNVLQTILYAAVHETTLDIVM